MADRKPKRLPGDTTDHFVGYVRFNGRLHTLGLFQTLEEYEVAAAQRRLELNQASERGDSNAGDSTRPNGGR